MSVLVAWVWQGLAIACATAALLACAPRINAATRHAIWWMACAAVLALPLAYAVVPPLSSASVAPATVPLPAAPDRLLASVLVAWTVFAVLGLVRIAVSVRVVTRLKDTGDTLDAGVAARLSPSPPAAASLRVSDRIPGACALGLGRPIILLSRSLVDTLDDEDLQAIVLHEHAHLARRDDWWQILQALVAAVAGWHPALWIIGRRIALEREAACDDRVVGRTRAPRAYARALVQAAESRRRWRAAVDGLAIPGAAASALRGRVRRLLDGRIDRASRPAPRTTLTALAMLTIAVTVAARVPAMVVFVDIASLLPRVDVSWPAHSAHALLSPLAAASDAQVAAVSRIAAADTASPAVPQEPVPVPAVPVAVGALPAPDGAGILPAAVFAAAPLVRDAEHAQQPPAASTRTMSWGAVGHAAASGGQRIGDGGAAVAGRAKDAGLSVGRFFSRAGKRIAGGA